MSTLKRRSADAVLAMLTAACGAGIATAGPPSLGEPLTAAEADGVDYTVLPDGTGLPAGTGSVDEGLEVYRQHCLACHGADGEGGPNDRLAGGRGTLAGDAPVRTVGSYWPYATTLFDYLRRAMPYTAPGSLGDEELYAVTAYVLYLNDIVDRSFVADARSLPAVAMPNRDGFDRAWPPETQE